MRQLTSGRSTAAKTANPLPTLLLKTPQQPLKEGHLPPFSGWAHRGSEQSLAPVLGRQPGTQAHLPGRMGGREPGAWPGQSCSGTGPQGKGPAPGSRRWGRGAAGSTEEGAGVRVHRVRAPGREVGPPPAPGRETRKTLARPPSGAGRTNPAGRGRSAKLLAPHPHPVPLPRLRGGSGEDGGGPLTLTSPGAGRAEGPPRWEWAPLRGGGAGAAGAG